MRACVGAAGEVQPDGARRLHGGVQRFRELQGAGLGLGDGLAAELAASARHQIGQQRGRVGGELCQERLRHQALDLLSGDIRQDEVLFHCDPDLAGAVLVRDSGELQHFRRLEPAHRDVQSDVVEPLLFLRVHAEEAPALPRGVHEVVAGYLDRAILHPLLHLGSEFLDPLFDRRQEFVSNPPNPNSFDGKKIGNCTYQLVDEPHHASLLSMAAGSEVAVGLQDCLAQGHDIVLGHPSVQGNGFRAPLGAEESSHQDVEPEDAVLRCRHVGEVVDVRVLE